MPKTKKHLISVYLILYDIVTTFLWSYLLILVFYHLFLAPTAKSAPLNPIPQAATYSTASSFIRSHLQKVLSLSTPPPTSPAAKAAAGVKLRLGGIAFALVEKARTTYLSRGIGVYTALVQSAAILEIIHAWFGWTTSPLVTTMMQVASRLIVIWWIGEGYETVTHQLSTPHRPLTDALLNSRLEARPSTHPC
jgi:very-long-chain (3R)-3-hydroxyacyl-CoA dehydratase